MDIEGAQADQDVISPDPNWQGEETRFSRKQAALFRDRIPPMRFTVLRKVGGKTMGDVLNVEVFRVGQWNGERFGTSDLDSMVSAFGRVGYTPPVKLGHDDSPGAMAFGWVSNLRRVGDKLLANLVDVPDSLIAMIRAKRYDSVSVEIFNDLVRDGVKFVRALKAIAILGAQIPGVSGLRPISESLGFGIEAPYTIYCAENAGEG